MYPLITIFVSGVVVVVLLVFVVPTFQTMFEDMGAALPGLTQMVIDLSNWVQSYFLYVFAAIGVMIYGIRMYYRTESGNAIIDKLLLKLPVFGDLLTKINRFRFLALHFSCFQ